MCHSVTTKYLGSSANKEAIMWIFCQRWWGKFSVQGAKKLHNSPADNGVHVAKSLHSCWKQAPCPTAVSGEYQEAELGWDHSDPVVAYPRARSEVGSVGSEHCAGVQPGMQVREETKLLKPVLGTNKM